MVISMERWTAVYSSGIFFLSGDLHVSVEDLRDGPDPQGGADGLQAREALRRHPHTANVDALQFQALVHECH